MVYISNDYILTAQISACFNEKGVYFAILEPPRSLHKYWRNEFIKLNNVLAKIRPTKIIFVNIKEEIITLIKDTGEPSIHIRLAEIGFDEVKKTRIQRFIETHSHPRYESGVQDFDMTILSETFAIVGDLLELVKFEDEKHYNFLVKSVEV